MSPFRLFVIVSPTSVLSTRFTTHWDHIGRDSRLHRLIMSFYVSPLRILAICSNTMSLRTHLDRYCFQRAMARDEISTPTRSRSPVRVPVSSPGTSPFHRPPGWTPPSTSPHRPVILLLDLKPMQQLADKNPYFNILAPKVAGNLPTATLTASSKPSR